jgi:biotin transporter BioY
MTLFITFLAFAFLLGFYRGKMNESKRVALLLATCIVITGIYFFFSRFL